MCGNTKGDFAPLAGACLDRVSLLPKRPVECAMNPCRDPRAHSGSRTRRHEIWTWRRISDGMAATNSGSALADGCPPDSPVLVRLGGRRSCVVLGAARICRSRPPVHPVCAHLHSDGFCGSRAHLFLAFSSGGCARDSVSSLWLDDSGRSHRFLGCFTTSLHARAPSVRGP